MKVILKSETLDLEIDDVAKLDDVLEFVEKFFALQQKAKEREKKPRPRK